MTQLPVDDNNQPIQVLRPRDGGAQTLVANNASTSTRSTSFGSSTKVLSIISDQPIFFNLGNSTVTATTATGHYLPASFYYDTSLIKESGNVDSHIAVLRATTSNATVYISEKI